MASCLIGEEKTRANTEDLDFRAQATTILSIQKKNWNKVQSLTLSVLELPSPMSGM